MSEEAESPQVRFILREWCPAFEQMDLDRIAKLMHKDFRLTTYPKSLGQPEQNKEQWLQRFTEVFTVLKENKVVSRFNRRSNPLHPG